MAISADFTPRPWTASVEAKPFDTGGHWYVVLDDEENGIGEFYGDDHEANAANSRLAAAAPELYEALDSLMARLSVTPIGLTKEELAELTAFAAPILAKARGEQVVA